MTEEDDVCCPHAEVKEALYQIVSIDLAKGFQFFLGKNFNELDIVYI